MKVCAFALATILLASCESAPPVTGQVGIFYGGQVQELEAIVLDPVRLPTFGIRVEVPSSALGEEHSVRWEVLRPGPAGRRVTELGEFVLGVGQKEIEQALPIDLRAAPGLMNVRVLVDDQVVIDRAIDVRKPR